MAKQFSVTINGSEVVLSSDSVMMVSTGASATSIFLRNNGGVLYSTSPIGTLLALANTGGTEQVQVTTIRVNDSNQISTIQMAFPVSSITVSPSTVSGSNSVILYQGARYYVSETPAAILEAANAGGGGGTPTLQEVLTEGSILTGNNTIDTDGNYFEVLVDTNNKFKVTNTGSTLTGNLAVANGGINMGTGSITDISAIQFNAGGQIQMIDTATSALMNVVITNGVFVITED